MQKVKNVLVTGGLGGIGLNICKLFIKKNHNLVIVDNLPKKFFIKRLLDHSITNKENTVLYKKIDLCKIIVFFKNNYTIWFWEIN